jgi:hypothetical protein
MLNDLPFGIEQQASKVLHLQATRIAAAWSQGVEKLPDHATRALLRGRTSARETGTRRTGIVL